jgi:flagellar basal body-associated protein FliL
MAEIHVQAKKHNSSPAWIWIIVVVLIAAAVIYFLMNRNNNQTDKPNQTNTTSYVELPQQLTDYNYVLNAA